MIDWCPHCPRLAPLVEQYQEKLKEEQVVFYKIYLPESGYSIVGEVCNDIGISSINAVPKLYANAPAIIKPLDSILKIAPN